MKMKKITTLTVLLAALISLNVSAQDNSSSEKYSGTLNLGLGIGYYGYVGHSLPVFHFAGMADSGQLIRDCWKALKPQNS